MDQLAIFFAQVTEVTNPSVPERIDIVAFFVEHLRGNLFNGYLTLAAFLLSAKTFIVVHLQKEVYSSDNYHKNIKDLRKLNSRLKFYGPLRRLNLLLFITVIASLITALLQLTVGLVAQPWAAWLCIGAAIVSLLPLFLSVWVMGSSMKAWFDELEEAAEKRANGTNQPEPKDCGGKG